MPGITIIGSPEASQRRLLVEHTSLLESEGIELIRTQEGGEWKDLFSTVQTRGLFSSRGYIRVESAEILGKFPEQLTNLVEVDHMASTFLLLVYSSDYKKYFPKTVIPVLRIIRSQQVPIWRNKRYEWLESEARNRNILINEDAVMLLIDNVADSEEVLSEMEKLALASDGAEVSVDLVRELTLDEGKNALLDLMDGICLGKVGTVISALECIKTKYEIIPVLSALYNRIRIASLILSFRQYGTNKVQKSLCFRDYQFKMAIEALKRYSPEDVIQFSADIITLDYREKTNNSRGWIALELMIMKFMALKGKK